MPPTGWNIGAAPVPSIGRDRAHPVPKIRLDERGEIVGIARAAVLERLVPAVVGVEIALSDQKSDELLLVVGGQRQIELVLIDGLDEEFVRPADHVGLDFAQRTRLLDSEPAAFPS